jgi:DNA-binding transcriptional LysR family regulator
MTDGNEGRRLLPPMAALNSFVAAARLGGFSRAGEAVGLTQSAVSRQVALLEDWVQASLFDRVGRRVTLNAQGRAYAAEIAPALERIRRATARVAGGRPTNTLDIVTLPSFGMRWLAPRLPRLTERHPELVVNLAARTYPLEAVEERFDAAIDFGRPEWPGMVHELLFREEAIPVCAPDWLAKNPIREPADFLGKPLLFQTSRRGAWDQWLRVAGVDAPPVPSGPSFEHFLMLAQAAAAGAGAALEPSFLIGPELESGSLVCPLAIPLTSDDAYYLVRPEGVENPALDRFCDWVVEEARDSPKG